MTNNSVPKYHSPNSCNKCAGETSLTIVDSMEHIVLEWDSVCKVCGFEDRWVTGFWESSKWMNSNCERY